MHLLVGHQAMTSTVDEICEGRENFERIAHNAEHLLAMEIDLVTNLERIVSFCHPDKIVVTDMLLPEQTHHCFVESNVNVHVSAGVYACNLLNKPP